MEQQAVKPYRQVAKHVYGVPQLPPVAPKTNQSAAQENLPCNDPRCETWPVFVSDTNGVREIFVANTRAVVDVTR